MWCLQVGALRFPPIWCRCHSFGSPCNLAVLKISSRHRTIRLNIPWFRIVQGSKRCIERFPYRLHVVYLLLRVGVLVSFVITQFTYPQRAWVAVRSDLVWALWVLALDYFLFDFDRHLATGVFQGSSPLLLRTSFRGGWSVCLLALDLIHLSRLKS